MYSNEILHEVQNGAIVIITLAVDSKRPMPEQC